MEISIRAARCEDGAAIAELLRGLEIFPKINAQPPEGTREQVSRQLNLCQSDDSHTVLVACDADGEIVGYSAVHWLPYLLLAGPEGYVSELFIRTDRRGMGIGGLLLKAVEEEARKRGCSRLMLLNIRKRESYQRQFYAKHGWVEREDAANFIFPL